MSAEGDVYDVVLVGAGTAGSSFAVSAAERGLHVAVVEQMSEIGGTLHRTSGFMSAAGTRRQRGAGIEGDSIELHRKDVLRVARQNYDDDMISRAVNAAPDFIDWLDSLGFRFHDDSPAIYYGHEPYLIPRTYWGESSGLSVIEVFKPLWDSYVEAGLIVPFLGHSLGELIVEDDRVAGVLVVSISSGEVVELRGRDVVLATGGFGSNPEFYMEATGRSTPPLSASMPGNTGAGHRAAMDHGARWREGKEILRIGHFALSNEQTRADLSIRGDFDALVRRPREIWVNKSGKRFTDESIEVNTDHEHVLLDQEEQTLWAIGDWPGLSEGQSIIRGWTPDDFVKAAQQGTGIVYIGDTLEELAVAAGLPPGNLVATVRDWNATVADNSEWSKWTQMSITTPPFVAIRCQGTILTTFSGLWTDSEHRVMKEDGSTFTNLYAIGEVMGVAAWSGESWPSGMCLTPALSLGRLLALELAEARENFGLTGS